jgi:hypothetical protein
VSHRHCTSRRVANRHRSIRITEVAHTQWEAVRVNEAHTTHSQQAQAHSMMPEQKCAGASIHQLSPLSSSHHHSSRALILTPFHRLSLLTFHSTSFFHMPLQVHRLGARSETSAYERPCSHQGTRVFFDGPPEPLEAVRQRSVSPPVAHPTWCG